MWSYEQFVVEGEELVALSQRQWTQRKGDKREVVAEWQWRHGKRPHLPGNSFLVSAGNVRTFRMRKQEAEQQQDGRLEAGAADDINALLEEEDCEMMDPASLGCECSAKAEEEEETVLFDFHIVFHAVYQAPVLYFRVTRLDGSPVSFHSSPMANELHLPGSGGRMPLVSMEDHQVLGTPFSFLHPCETASPMALLLDQPTTTNANANANATATATTSTSWNSADSSGKRTSPTYLLAWLSLVQPLTGIDPRMY